MARETRALNDLGQREGLIMSSSSVTTNDPSMAVLHYPSQWHRVGKGKSAEVDASPAELAAILQDLARIKGASWQLIGCHQVRDGKEWQLDFPVIPLSAMAKYVEQGCWQFYLWDPRITPGLAEHLPAKGAQAAISLCGLLNIQCAHQTNRGRAKPALGLVDRIRNIVSGEKLFHEAYARIYQSIRRSLRAASMDHKSGTTENSDA